MPANTIEVKALHVADLNGVLERYGQLRDFAGGNMRCYVCSDVTTPENAGSIKHADGRLALTCNKTSCYRRVVANTGRLRA